MAEYNSAGALLRRYLHGPGPDEPFLWYEGADLTSNRRRLQVDHQGSIVAVTDTMGNVLAIDSYDSWGIPGAANIGRFQYTGQAWIDELGMYYYKARIYSPTLGRFIQTDPIGYDDQINLYAYVANDPISHVDPTGEEIVLAGHQVAGGVTHMKIVFIPENQARYSRDANFQNRLPDGRRYATLGGGPEGGRLVGRPNRPNDLKQYYNNYRHVLQLPKGMTEDRAISRMFAADAAYSDKLDYDLFPNGIFGTGADGYNSNSYAGAILDRAGITDIPKPSGAVVPGFRKPIPAVEFDVQKEQKKMLCIGSRIERTSC